MLVETLLLQLVFSHVFTFAPTPVQLLRGSSELRLGGVAAKLISESERPWVHRSGIPAMGKGVLQLASQNQWHHFLHACVRPDFLFGRAAVQNGLLADLHGFGAWLR